MEDLRHLEIGVEEDEFFVLDNGVATVVFVEESLDGSLVQLWEGFLEDSGCFSQRHSARIISVTFLKLGSELRFTER